jgi:hypothetical protein
MAYTPIGYAPETWYEADHPGVVDSPTVNFSRQGFTQSFWNGQVWYPTTTVYFKLRCQSY